MKDKETYILEELDRSHLANTFAGDRLKKFHLCQQLQLDYIPNLGHEEVSTLNQFFVGNSNSKLSNTPNNYF